MRILIIDQCSGSKNHPESSDVYTADDIDGKGLKDLLERDGSAAIKARNLYAGRQQKYVDGAVDNLRRSEHEVDRYFISAGFGLIEENDLLPPYEVTFSGMTATEISNRSTHLKITDKVVDLITSKGSYNIVFLPLGTDYYQALNLERMISACPTKTTIVLFNQEELAEKVGNVVSIPARTKEAKKYGKIVVGLKGVFLQYFAENLAKGAMVKTKEDVVKLCTTEPTKQAGFDQFN
ncbi:hypothetical protein [Haladaptatus sp. CMSO5]|uniref:hypothetical protein n=1 Tax=Haladaptatus sp. CMSO5 TaxID=3120514 RepID=UPI002FCDFAD8